MQNKTASTHIPSKANFTSKDPNTCIEEELSTNELKKNSKYDL
jgi:hypothetical protein